MFALLGPPTAHPGGRGTASPAPRARAPCWSWARGRRTSTAVVVVGLPGWRCGRSSSSSVAGNGTGHGGQRQEHAKADQDDPGGPASCKGPVVRRPPLGLRRMQSGQAVAAALGRLLLPAPVRRGLRAVAILVLLRPGRCGANRGCWGGGWPCQRGCGGGGGGGGWLCQPWLLRAVVGSSSEGGSFVATEVPLQPCSLQPARYWTVIPRTVGRPLGHPERCPIDCPST